LKNAEANADSKNLEPEELFIKNIVVQQAPVRRLSFDRPPKTITESPFLVRKPGEGRIVPMVALTPIRDILAT